MPTSQTTTIPTDAGLTTPPIAVEGERSAPRSTPATTVITSRPSRTGVSAPTRKVSGRAGPTAMSQTRRTIVCTAMPPIRLPAASPRFPCAAAETVIASSGRLPASARSSRPPSSSPSPRRVSSTSVVFESAIPATHVAAAPAAKTTTRSGVPSDDTLRTIRDGSDGEGAPRPRHGRPGRNRNPRRRVLSSPVQTRRRRHAVGERKRVSMDEVEAEEATSLPNKEVMSLLDVNANVDLGLDLAAPVDLAAAANLNVAAPIEAAASANVLSPDGTSVSEAYQRGSIDQGISGSADATAPQHATVAQDSGTGTGTAGGAATGATPAPAETGTGVDSGAPAAGGAVVEPAGSAPATDSPAASDAAPATADSTPATTAAAPTGDAGAVGDAATGAASGAAGAVDGATGAVGDAASGATGAVEGATGAAAGAAGGAASGVTGGADSLLNGGSLLDANVNIDANANLAAPIDGAIAANANVAAPIDAAVSANIGSPGATAEALAPQEVNIDQNLDGVTADATATQNADVQQK